MLLSCIEAHVQLPLDAAHVGVGVEAFTMAVVVKMQPFRNAGDAAHARNVDAVDAVGHAVEEVPLVRGFEKVKEGMVAEGR